VRLRQIRRRTPPHLEFLLEETVALTQLADLSISTSQQRRTGVNGCLLGARAGEPLRECHRVDTEVASNALDRHAGLAVLRDTHHVIAETAGPNGPGILRLFGTDLNMEGLELEPDSHAAKREMFAEFFSRDRTAHA
jgi:hypothetical protein